MTPNEMRIYLDNCDGIALENFKLFSLMKLSPKQHKAKIAENIYNTHFYYNGSIRPYNLLLKLFYYNICTYNSLNYKNHHLVSKHMKEMLF